MKPALSIVDPSTSHTGDFRLYLQQELVRRCKCNPRYSLRGFALAIGVEPAELSKFLSGKRRITPFKFEMMSSRLGLSPQQKKLFGENLIHKRRPQSEKKERDFNYKTVTFDTFQVIADWYHFAILELTATETFEPDPRWISRALGISIHEVHSAVDRLIRLEFLKITPDGKWIDCSGGITTIGNEFTAIALRKLQHSILDKAKSALDELSIEIRDQTSMTMAIDSSLLPEAKKRITHFRRSLYAFLQSGKRKDHVYQLGVSIFPLTLINKDT